jgi:membrane protease YdiL (CAAX protease family)
MINAHQKYLLLEVLLFTFFIALFSFFIHAAFPLRIMAFGALITGAAFIAKRIGFPFQLSVFFGYNQWSARLVLGCVLALCAGLILGFLYRYQLVVKIIPAKLGWFIIIAAVIGICEEFIFRGYVLDVLSGFPAWIALSLSSLSHTIYKCFIFIPLINSHPVNIGLLFIFTFAGGLFFGWLKLYTRSTIPPALAHGIFDIIAYMGNDTAPWWVW